jgi:hypothetical protein
MPHRSTVVESVLSKTDRANKPNVLSIIRWPEPSARRHRFQVDLM